MCTRWRLVATRADEKETRSSYLSHQRIWAEDPSELGPMGPAGSAFAAGPKPQQNPQSLKKYPNHLWQAVSVTGHSLEFWWCQVIGAVNQVGRHALSGDTAQMLYCRSHGKIHDPSPSPWPRNVARHISQIVQLIMHGTNIMDSAWFCFVSVFVKPRQSQLVRGYGWEPSTVERKIKTSVIDFWILYNLFIIIIKKILSYLFTLNIQKNKKNIPHWQKSWIKIQDLHIINHQLRKYCSSFFISDFDVFERDRGYLKSQETYIHTPLLCSFSFKVLIHHW